VLCYRLYAVLLLLCCTVICVALLLFVLSYVLIVCTVPLPPGVNPIAVDKYSNINKILSEGRTGEGWEPSEKQCHFGSWRALDRDIFLLFVTDKRNSGGIYKGGSESFRPDQLFDVTNKTTLPSFNIFSLQTSRLHRASTISNTLITNWRTQR